MKNESQDWLDWLHNMRREEEERRVREGKSLREWLRQVNAEADAIIAELASQSRRPVARDKPPQGSQP
jgi:hypothetical protein